jgi:hypothetical protein
MHLPYVIGNREHILADVLNHTLRSDAVHARDVRAFDLLRDSADGHHLLYKALVHRITATDLLIDQANRPIAHQLYRLTADEIALMERRSTPDGGNTR